MFAVLMAIMLSQGITLAVEHGYTPWSAFAYDTTVTTLQNRVNVTAQIILERDMKDKEKDLCTTKDPGYKRELADDIDRLQKEYRNITGFWYKLRGCKEI